MSTTPANTQLYALRRPPPRTLTVAGRSYRIVRIFKHDFYAATCLYASPGDAEAERIVVKFYRTQVFCGLPMHWAGRLMRNRERAIYAALAGLEGVPRWLGRVGPTGLAVEYVPGCTLEGLDGPPPPGFFDKLRALMDAIHARGVAYCDANKRSNVIVGSDGRPFLVDFQISIRLRPGWPAPLRRIVSACVRYVQRCDLYHLYKHKRRMSPDELTGEEERLSRRRGLLHTLHRKLTDPWRAFRRRFLRRRRARGLLESPTKALEDLPAGRSAPGRARQLSRGGGTAKAPRAVP